MEIDEKLLINGEFRKSSKRYINKSEVSSPKHRQNEISELQLSSVRLIQGTSFRHKRFSNFPIGSNQESSNYMNVATPKELQVSPFQSKKILKIPY